MRLEPPDLELWHTGFIRDSALAAGIKVDVGNKEPTNLQLPLGRPLIVVRDDGGQRLDWTTFQRSIGVSVLAGTREHDQPSNDLARWLAGLLFDDAIIDAQNSPIVSVEWDGCNGPYAVPEDLDVARRYLTAQYVVTGSW